MIKITYSLLKHIHFNYFSKAFSHNELREDKMYTLI